MTDQRITTEEAERIAFAIQGRAMEVTGAGELVYDEELRDAADALRSLAAERDELKNETSVTVCGGDHARRWLAMADGCPMCLADENERLREALRATRDFTALRSLAAERDELREAMETATDCCARATACGRIIQDALGENQP